MESGVTHNAGGTEDGMGGGSGPEFRWLERGEGEPVVLLHGFMGRMDHWEAALEYLGDQCRPMALSLPIFDARLGEVSIPELARHVARFLDALDIPRAVVGGNSLGGHVALELALSWPHRVSGLILAGSSGLFERGFTRGVPRRPTAEYVRAKLEEVVYDRALVTPSWVESVRRIANTRSCALRLVRFAKAAKRDSIADRLPALRVPTFPRGAWPPPPSSPHEIVHAHTVTGRGTRRGSGDGSGEPFRHCVTTTQRPRVGTAPRVTGTESAVVTGPIPPAPAASPVRRAPDAFANRAG